MLIGYARISKTDGSQALDLQKDALIKAGVDTQHIYEDHASGKHADRPGLTSCLKGLREGDILVVWKLDRLGRNLKHLVTTVQELAERGYVTLAPDYPSFGDYRYDFAASKHASGSIKAHSSQRDQSFHPG